MDLTSLLSDAVRREASDVHLHANRRPLVRIDGRLEPVGSEVLSEDDVDRMTRAMMPAPRVVEFATTNETDFAYEVPGIGRFRVNVYREQGAAAAVMRSVRFEIRDFEALGLPPVVRRIADEPRGLVLVTGRIGAGKTTTLAAMIDHINETRDGHILTIEDPVEIRHPDKRCVVSQRDVGLDTDGFRAALKRALRQDPDVIFIGEMRDQETVAAALSAAETGHLVLSTLHTVNATETVNRILDFYPPDQHLQVRARWPRRCAGSSANVFSRAPRERDACPRSRCWSVPVGSSIASWSRRRPTRSRPSSRRAATTACRPSTSTCSSSSRGARSSGPSHSAPRRTPTT